MAQYLTKKQFMKEFEDAILPDVRDREDCEAAWLSAIDAYLEDGIVSNRAYSWVNPYLNQFESCITEELTNKDRIAIAFSESKSGYHIGCYNPKIDMLSSEDLEIVIKAAKESEWIDIPVKLGRVEYLVEIKTVDNEKDFDLVSRKEFTARYGNN